jgi:hypothetical protein
MARTDHVLALPSFVLAFRILQLVTALAIMGLAGYGITEFSFDGIDLTLFSAIATIIIAIYVIVASTGAPVIYNYWAILGLDIFAIVFWIISFSLLASEVAAYDVVPYTDTCLYYYYGVCYYKRSLEKRNYGARRTFRNAMAAASGLGGLEFIFFVVTLIMTSIWLHRHRKAGGHCMPGRSGAVATEPKPEMPVQTQYPPAQTQYQPAQAQAQAQYPPAQTQYPPAQAQYPPAQAQAQYPPAQTQYPPA